MASASTATLPSSLAFLVSNFHSLVNIKLDASNYLLWRIQVESVMEANGFYGYLDGTIPTPSSEIRNEQGEVSVNPAYTLWKLIDLQLKSCLNASLSQTTLPYVLGLRSAHQVWDSLAKRYNTLSETHVQELKDELYSVSKTSTIDAYIDKIQEISQKLTVAGSIVEDDELVFRTLQGLPKAFNGLRTAVRAVRTRGHKVSFDELVTMMKSEDAQLGKEASELETQNTVLVASHGNRSDAPSRRNISSSVSQNFGNTSQPSQQTLDSGIQSGGYSYGGPNLSQPQFSSQQSQQFFPSNSRNFNRGKGGRQRSPCDICGRNNHSTNYCYYRPNGPGYQWRGYSNTPQFYPTNASPSYPTVYGPQGFSVPQNAFPQFSAPNAFPQFSALQRPNENFRVLPMMQSNGPIAPPVMSQYSSSTATPTAFAGFTGQNNVTCVPSNYYGPGIEMQSAVPLTEHSSPPGSVTHPWYFDSGATNHVTNNVHNIDQPQQSGVNEGVLVGNGHNLQVTHSGQNHSSNPLPGTMSQGTVPYSDSL